MSHSRSIQPAQHNKKSDFSPYRSMPVPPFRFRAQIDHIWNSNGEPPLPPAAPQHLKHPPKVDNDRLLKKKKSRALCSGPAHVKLKAGPKLCSFHAIVSKETCLSSYFRSGGLSKCPEYIGKKESNRLKSFFIFCFVFKQVRVGGNGRRLYTIFLPQSFRCRRLHSRTIGLNTFFEFFDIDTRKKKEKK